jgi:hypothetical protein
MSFSLIPRAAGALLGLVLVPHVALAAENDRSSTPPSKATPAAKGGTGRTSSARGPLPDPALLDGANHPAEKKSEYGMIGDFELPGDENARNNRVGGPQTPGQQGGQQGQQNTAGGGGLPSLPQAGGGGQQQGGQPPPQAAGGQQQSGGGSGPENPNAAGQQVAGGGDPNAKAEGQQVSQLGGEGGAGEAGNAGEKPPPVAIGDQAMRLPAPAQSASVVGAQQQVQGNTQHHEKGTGSGGKGPTGVQGNNRVEKGRTIPAGL